MSACLDAQELHLLELLNLMSVIYPPCYIILTSFHFSCYDKEKRLTIKKSISGCSCQLSQCVQDVPEKEMHLIHTNLEGQYCKNALENRQSL